MAVTTEDQAVWQSECQCENQTASEIMRVRLGLGVTGQVSPTLGVAALAACRNPARVVTVVRTGPPFYGSRVPFWVVPSLKLLSGKNKQEPRICV